MSLKDTMMSKKVWAVVGVSENKEKWGYKLYKVLKDHGYKVYGVNPRLESLEGDKVYNSLKEIDDKIEVVDIVVNPKFAMDYVKEAKDLGIENLFFQPGSYDEELINEVENLKINYVKDCVYATLCE